MERLIEGVVSTPSKHVNATAVGWVLAVAITILVVGGVVDLFVTRIPVFALDAEVHEFRTDFGYAGPLGWEFRLPVFFSSAVLVCASVAAVRSDKTGPGSPLSNCTRVCSLLSALFAFMAVDEAVGIHELLEVWTGVDWQHLYLPLAVCASLLWGRVLLRIIREPAVIPWIGGAACWFLSQCLEAFRWGTDFSAIGAANDEPDPFEPGEATWRFLTASEELLEMLGTSLLLLSMLLLASRYGPTPTVRGIFLTRRPAYRHHASNQGPQ